MSANDDSETVAMGETDALDEVALASVNDAIEAVENETVVESGQVELSLIHISEPTRPC